MAQLQLKGFFQHIGQIETVGEKQTKIQKIIFKVPGYVDDFGDKKNNDELWELTVIGSNVDKLDLLNKTRIGNKGVLKCFANSRTWYKKEDTAKSEPNFSIEAVLYEVEHLS